MPPIALPHYCPIQYEEMKLPIYQVDAFAEKLFTGNPAAVCPLEEWLPDDILQAIAAENNLSETVYFVKEDDSYRIRWFTPKSEVALCGHATLAAAYIIFHLGHPDSLIAFNSLSGHLQVSKDNERLTLDFPQQKGVSCETPQALIDALGKQPSACFASQDYMVVFDNEAEIIALAPDFHSLRDLDLRGVIVTAPGTSVDFVSRFFAPKYGIDEDPVTGSAHCVMAPYWAERLQKTTLTARQLSERTGNLLCELQEDRVLISGEAVLYLEGSIEI